MAVDVVVPQMGESVLEGTILEWKVKVGDTIEINQPLVELMTDKVNVEIPAEVAGVLAQIFVQEGEVVPVGSRIASIDDGTGDAPAATAEAPKQSAAATKPAAKAAAASTPVVSAPFAVKGTAAAGKGKMSPKVRLLIREFGLDAGSIIPTGKNGLILVDDVTRAAGERSSSAGFTPGPIPSPAPLPASAAQPSSPAAAKEPRIRVQIPVFEPMPENQRITRMPLAGARKMIAEHMVKSLQTSSHVTTFEDIDLTEMARFRREIKHSFIETYGANITYMPFIIKATCVALREFPALNASLTDTEILLKNYYNIGIAVARDDGLIVPIIKNADRKSIVELAVEITELGEKARTNRLLPDDVSDGTFTLTNAGMFGATSSTPIIAQPQVAILGIHAVTKRPWVVDDQIVICEISSFGLSFDHRLIDGHIAVQFLHRIHEYLADTKRLLLQLR